MAHGLRCRGPPLALYTGKRARVRPPVPPEVVPSHDLEPATRRQSGLGRDAVRREFELLRHPSEPVRAGRGADRGPALCLRAERRRGGTPDRVEPHAGIRGGSGSGNVGRLRHGPVARPLRGDDVLHRRGELRVGGERILVLGLLERPGDGPHLVRRDHMGPPIATLSAGPELPGLRVRAAELVVRDLPVCLEPRSNPDRRVPLRLHELRTRRRHRAVGERDPPGTARLRVQ